MELYFIRHAQSENNALWAETGSWRGRVSDPDLTAIGHRQAEHLAAYLKRPEREVSSAAARHHNRHNHHFTHLYCSLMQRAVLTGTYVAHALDLPLVAWEELHESGGIFLHDEETEEPRGLPGNNRAFFVENYPQLQLPDSLGPEGWWNRPLEREEAVPARARRFLDMLQARHGDTEDRVAVVSHAGFYNALLTVLLGVCADRDEDVAPGEVWFGLNNAAITRIDFRDEVAIILYQNRVAHLPAELLT